MHNAIHGSDNAHKATCKEGIVYSRVKAHNLFRLLCLIEIVVCIFYTYFQMEHMCIG